MLQTPLSVPVFLPLFNTHAGALHRTYLLLFFFTLSWNVTYSMSPHHLSTKEPVVSFYWNTPFGFVASEYVSESVTLFSWLRLSFRKKPALWADHNRLGLISNPKFWPTAQSVITVPPFLLYVFCWRTKRPSLPGLLVINVFYYCFCPLATALTLLYFIRFQSNGNNLSCWSPVIK